MTTTDREAIEALRDAADLVPAITGRHRHVRERACEALAYLESRLVAPVEGVDSAYNFARHIAAIAHPHTCASFEASSCVPAIEADRSAIARAAKRELLAEFDAQLAHFGEAGGGWRFALVELKTKYASEGES